MSQIALSPDPEAPQLRNRHKHATQLPPSLQSPVQPLPGPASDSTLPLGLKLDLVIWLLIMTLVAVWMYVELNINVPTETFHLLTKWLDPGEIQTQKQR